MLKNGNRDVQPPVPTTVNVPSSTMHSPTTEAVDLQTVRVALANMEKDPTLPISRASSPSFASGARTKGIPSTNSLLNSPVAEDGALSHEKQHSLAVLLGISDPFSSTKTERETFKGVQAIWQNLGYHPVGIVEANEHSGGILQCMGVLKSQAELVYGIIFVIFLGDFPILPVHSDHCPLLIRCFGLPKAKGPCSFHFLTAWASHLKYSAVVRSSWEKGSPNVVDRLIKV
ncbi:hypothetical protein PIB30_022650 [Stylosanthes scabra]|uniref:Uncharacterized protein n=1 Tax=Stylosanthes scabra TaxID=79078 RepID=A0ABU6U853_9FABA|nr:hypothetical protein [Stylosanthes scabra]